MATKSHHSDCHLVAQGRNWHQQRVVWEKKKDKVASSKQLAKQRISFFFSALTLIAHLQLCVFISKTFQMHNKKTTLAIDE